LYFANILIKTREGRPIKVENNVVDGVKLSANARVHASVLSLYDSGRLKTPKIANRLLLGLTLMQRLRRA